MSDESFSAIEETRFRFCEEIALLNLFLPIFDWHVHVGQEVVVHPSSKINQSSFNFLLFFNYLVGSCLYSPAGWLSSVVLLTNSATMSTLQSQYQSIRSSNPFCFGCVYSNGSRYSSLWIVKFFLPLSIRMFTLKTK